MRSADQEESRDLAARAVRAVAAAVGGRLVPLAGGMTSHAWRAQAGDRDWVVRVPVAGSGRRMTYRVEAQIGAALAARGHEVPTWRIVEVDHVPISVGPYLPGIPITDDQSWDEPFARPLAAVMTDLHGQPCQGFGPLEDRDAGLIGISSDPASAVVDRWCHASMWPFDGSELNDHLLAGVAPDVVAPVAERRDAILAAAEGRRGLVHSDLHPQHLLVGPDRTFAGLLDFGDVFIGSRAWDFASLIHYYDMPAAVAVARRYGAGVDEGLLDDAHQLAVAVAVYKIAKTAGRTTDVNRLRARLRAMTST